jgi:hypothetical protein
MTREMATRAQDAVAAAPVLAEPRIPGGRVEAAMGRLIRVMSSSPLARPVPAVTLSALGLGLLAFAGLCANPSSTGGATLPVELPLTALAQRLGAPTLPGSPGYIVGTSVLTDWAGAVMYTGITLCCLGLAGMLWANSQGWSPTPRRVFLTAAAAVAAVVNITPVGTSDPASYATYGRIAALGHDPYVYLPFDLPGGIHNPYTALVGTQWRKTPSVYGPVATWTHLAAALAGGSRPWLAIWLLIIMTGIAFLAAGYLLLRSAANPVRAGLIWAANPLLIYLLVMGAQLDALLALAGLAAILVSRRGAGWRPDVTAGALIGIADGIKVNAVLVAFGLAVPLIRERAWARLARTAAAAAAVTLALYQFSYGLHTLKPVLKGSSLVISPSLWRIVQVIGDNTSRGVSDTLITVLWPPLTLLLAWYLYHRLSPDVPAVLAATCAATFAWVLMAPWTLPWYTALAWATLALLPRNTLTRWLTLVTGALALVHFNAGHEPIPPAPSQVTRHIPMPL